MRRARSMCAIAAVLALGLAGCDWVTFHGGMARTGWQGSESTIGVGNVSQLAPTRTFSGTYSPPVLAGGVLYSLSGNGTLQAYDATGADHCSGSPLTCSPMWTSSTVAGQSITVDHGKVYAAGMTSQGGNGLWVYDAAGVTNCGGTPKVCDPLWTTGAFHYVGPGAPVVSNGVVYVSGYRSIEAPPGNAYVIAYDAAGSTNCSLGVCAPLWWTSGATGDVLYSAPIAAGNGLVFAVSGGSASKVVSFDAAGSQGCSGSPKVCAPVWSASPPTSLSYGGPAVADGTLYVAGYGQTLYAYDAVGSTSCSGAPKTCSPLWTAAVGDTRNTPAVGEGMVYVENVSGTVRAFDATGTDGCTGSPKVCTARWTYAPNVTGYLVGGSPAGANGVLYEVTPDSLFRALDASGSIGCSGMPKTCTPLWSYNTGYISSDASPAIVNDTVYWNSGTVHTTWAFALP